MVRSRGQPGVCGGVDSWERQKGSRDSASKRQKSRKVGGRGRFLEGRGAKKKKKRGGGRGGRERGAGGGGGGGGGVSPPPAGRRNWPRKPPAPRRSYLRPHAGAGNQDPRG